MTSVDWLHKASQWLAKLVCVQLLRMSSYHKEFFHTLQQIHSKFSLFFESLLKIFCNLVLPVNQVFHSFPKVLLIVTFTILTVKPQIIYQFIAKLHM